MYTLQKWFKNCLQNFNLEKINKIVLILKLTLWKVDKFHHIIEQAKTDRFKLSINMPRAFKVLPIRQAL